LPVSITANAPPTVNLTAPASNSSVIAPANITLSANAADPDGTVAKVEFFNGMVLLGTVTVVPYSCTWNSAPVGTYSITATATDNLGATVTSSAVSVTVKNSVAQVFYIHTDHPPRQCYLLLVQLKYIYSTSGYEARADQPVRFYSSGCPLHAIAI